MVFTCLWYWFSTDRRLLPLPETVQNESETTKCSSVQFRTTRRFFRQAEVQGNVASPRYQFNNILFRRVSPACRREEGVCVCWTEQPTRHRLLEKPWCSLCPRPTLPPQCPLKLSLARRLQTLQMQPKKESHCYHVHCCHLSPCSQDHCEIDL